VISINRLILFTSYYFATKAETYLKGNGIPIKLIATPPQLNDCCGLCILLGEEDVEQAKALMVKGKISHSGIFTYSNTKEECYKLP